MTGKVGRKSQEADESRTDISECIADIEFKMFTEGIPNFSEGLSVMKEISLLRDKVGVKAERATF